MRGRYTDTTQVPARALVLVGGGEHAVVVADAARAAGWTLRGYSEQGRCPALEDAFGVPFLGDDAQATKEHADAVFIVAVGTQSVRGRVVKTLEALSVHFATVVHPRATVAPSATIEPGAAVLAGAVLNPGARVGSHAIVNTSAVIEHDVVLERLVHVSPAAAIGGGARILEGAVIGLGARVRDHVTVGARAVVGMGAVVVADVPAGITVMGVPARARSEHREAAV